MTYSSVNDPEGFCDAMESESNAMTPDQKELIETKQRLAEFEDQLRYVFENIASEVYAFGECHCDHEHGCTPCAYCASEHFWKWYQQQPEFIDFVTVKLDECET